MPRHIDRRHFIAAAASIALYPIQAACAQTAAVIEKSWNLGGLVGSVMEPAQAGRGPAVLLLAGSGPTDRDGNQPGLPTDCYRLIATGLAAAGIRSLRYDKRGVGGSRGLMAGKHEEDIRLGMFVDDAVAAARSLAGRPDVSSVVLVGHSEGALVATLAAEKVSVSGLVLLAGAGRRADALMREQIQKAPAPDQIRTEALSILDAIAAGHRVENVPKPFWALFRPSVQPYLLSWFAVDPAAEFMRLSVPALIVQGGRDIQVARADFDALVKARPDARAIVLPEANHVFKAAPADLSDRQAQVRSYAASAPLDPGLVPAIVDFMQLVKQ
jgi:pimeloyl-ACP methyl ester carboxylesterase